MSRFDQLVARDCVFPDADDESMTRHFVGISDAHLGGYCCLDPIYTDLSYVDDIANEMVAPYVGRDIGVIVTPAIGSIPLAVLAAKRLRKLEGRHDIEGIWADKVTDANGKTTLAFSRPGFAQLLAGKNVAAFDDYINRMHTISRLITAARGAGATVLGAGCIAANGSTNVTAKALDVPTFASLCEVTYRTWSPEECPKVGPCSRAVPIVADQALGHGYELRQQQPDYPGGYVALLG